jgi:hypothetical protein
MGMRVLSCFIFAFLLSADPWLTEKFDAFDLVYTEVDANLKEEYVTMITSGIDSVNKFIGHSFSRRFQVYVHPDRKSLDAQWQKDWGMADFKSECWMVASGVSGKMDLLSPRVWIKHACEHSFSDKFKTRQLITHELFHVYHAQVNPGNDFNNVSGLDWLVEGFATYASGQLDHGRIQELKESLTVSVPFSLDQFWTGKLRYGLAGSAARYIDQKFGRTVLLSLLISTTLDQVLQKLGLTEQQFLLNWKQFVMTL